VVVPYIICLYGDLGMGKTTFVQGFAKGLGITSRLLSPTFIIVRRYELTKKFTFFYHMDLYRIHELHDMKELGLSEIFEDQKSIVIIEWADRLDGKLPKNRLDIRFSIGSEPSERRIEQTYVRE